MGNDAIDAVLAEDRADAVEHLQRQAGMVVGKPGMAVTGQRPHPLGPADRAAPVFECDQAVSQQAIEVLPYGHRRHPELGRQHAGGLGAASLQRIKNAAGHAVGHDPKQ